MNKIGGLLTINFRFKIRRFSAHWGSLLPVCGILDTRGRQLNINEEIPGLAETIELQARLWCLRELGHPLQEASEETLERLLVRRDAIGHNFECEPEDEALIAESLAFILEFIAVSLEERLDQALPTLMLRDIQPRIFTRRERYEVAQQRLQKWLKATWPDGHSGVFKGTYDCPVCRLDFLAIGHHDRPFCFSCATSVNAAIYPSSCEVYLKAETPEIKVEDFLLDWPAIWSVTALKPPLTALKDTSPVMAAATPSPVSPPVPKAKAPAAPKEPRWGMPSSAALSVAGLAAGVLFALLIRPRF